MITVKIELETAKGKRQVTLWGITQERPYPDITSAGGGLKWRNAPELFPQYGQPATGLAAVYRVALLREGWTAETAQDNRNDYAGFVPYHETEPIAGAIVFRGRSLGETGAKIDARPHGWGGVAWQVRGNEAPTPTERDLLDSQVGPALRAAVAEHAAELRADAVAGIRATVAEKVGEARAAVDRLEAEAVAAIAAL